MVEMKEKKHLFEPFFLFLKVAFLFEVLVMKVRSTFFLAMTVIRKEQEESSEYVISVYLSHS